MRRRVVGSNKLSLTAPGAVIAGTTRTANSSPTGEQREGLPQPKPGESVTVVTVEIQQTHRSHRGDLPHVPKGRDVPCSQDCRGAVPRGYPHPFQVLMKLDPPGRVLTRRGQNRGVICQLMLVVTGRPRPGRCAARGPSPTAPHGPPGPTCSRSPYTRSFGARGATPGWLSPPYGFRPVRSLPTRATLLPLNFHHAPSGTAAWMPIQAGVARLPQLDRCYFYANLDVIQPCSSSIPGRIPQVSAGRRP